MNNRGFGSDNFSGVLPEVMKALIDANYGHHNSYGDDDYSRRATAKFNELFGRETDVYLTFNGTGANVTGIASCISSYNSVVCAETAHINVDECGALEKITGSKILTLQTFDGKITKEHIEKYMCGFGFEHHSQPKVVSITQSTELGTVYTPEEIKDICDYAHSYGLYVHMDGARIANAVAHLQTDIKEITVNAGIDVLSFGGTKNGMMFGEAVIFFNKELSQNTKYIRKQNMQLFSKMRYIAAQFEAVLTDNLWLKTATHANNMATLLAKELEKIPHVKITQDVESNEVFAIIPGDIVESLQKEYFFYIWDENSSEARFVCSFDTTENDIMNFISKFKELID